MPTQVSNRVYVLTGTGEVGSTADRIEVLNVNTISVSGSTDLADASVTGDSAISNPASVAVDPARGKLFLQNSNGVYNYQVYSMPIAGGPLTSIYTPPDTAQSSAETGALGGIAIDSAHSYLYFAQSDFDPNTGINYPASTGIFRIGEAGGATTQVINDVSTMGVTLNAPGGLVLDLKDNLVFFSDIQFDAAANVLGYDLDVGNLSTGDFRVLLTNTTASSAAFSGLAINSATNTLYYSTVDHVGGVASANGVYAATFTAASGFAALGASHALYTNFADATPPNAIAIDPATNALYIEANDSTGTPYYGRTYGGSLTASGALASSLTSLFQVAGTAGGNGILFQSAPTVTTGGTVTFNQGGSAVTLDAGLTVSDQSTLDLASATVTISAGTFAGDGDTLAATVTGTSITASYSNETLTLTGVDTAAHYQQVLDSVRYGSTSANAGNTGANPTRTITWAASDGVLASNPGTSTVNISVPPPMLVAGGTATFTGGGAAVALDPGLTVSNSASIANATITISTGYFSGDTLGFTSQNGITALSNSGGTLVLTGAASAANYQTALDSVAYGFTPTNGDPTGGGSHTSRTISYVANNGINSSTTVTSTLTDAHAAPSVTAGAATPVAAGNAATTLDAGLTLSVPDSGGNLASGTVAISAGLAASDALHFVNQNGITGSVSANGGTLTLSGTATAAQYQTALESVTYTDGGDFTVGQTESSRTISYSVNDGVANSAVATSTIVACFAAGTRIRTPFGELPVENLREGDLVATVLGRGPARVRWLGHRRVDCGAHPEPDTVWPIHVRAHALGDGLPLRDLWLSPEHAVHIDGALVPAHCLITGSSITQERRDTIAYYHIELDAHDVLLAEGLPCESYRDTGNRAAFVNGGMSAAIAGETCAPLVEGGRALAVIRAGLLRRAAEIGLCQAAGPEAAAAAPHLLADGTVITAERVEGGSHRFRVPRATRFLRLVSSAAVPEGGERRVLGVCVTGIAVEGQRVALDDPALRDGWHGLERQASGPAWRWTGGDAALVAPAALVTADGEASVSLVLDLIMRPEQRRAA